GAPPQLPSIGLPELPTVAAPSARPMPLVIAQPGSCDACSLLMQHDFDALKAGKACDLCGAADPTVCEGWPEPGMVGCETYDWLRNCIYARLGYDFNTAEEWRVTFEQEPWYVPDPRFKWERVTPLQQENARILRELVKKRRCVE
ncbi:MAG: YARHG domain-containing protein, partial [Alphaproteobacteria bacterium]|nr:YARHG domain-containing protein [Alphaproteobacteria bacterium]